MKKIKLKSEIFHVICKMCDENGLIINPEFEVCSKWNDSDIRCWGFNPGECKNCFKTNPAIYVMCSEGEKVKCFNCWGDKVKSFQKEKWEVQENIEKYKEV